MLWSASVLIGAFMRSTKKQFRNFRKIRKIKKIKTLKRAFLNSNPKALIFFILSKSDFGYSKAILAILKPPSNIISPFTKSHREQ